MNGKPEDSNKPVEPGKTVTIIVNGTDKTVAARSELSFDDLVWLAFEEKLGNQNIVYTITYSRTAGGLDEQSLTRKQSVKVVEGMIFDVDRTDNS